MLIPARHTRRSVRMRGHDYACAGAYFLTLVCNERRRLFGEITSSGAILNRIGNVVDAEWTATAEIRKEVQLGPHILMPNHLHAIVFLIKANDRHDHGTPSSVSAAHAKGPAEKVRRLAGCRFQGGNHEETSRGWPHLARHLPLATQLL